MFPASYAEYLGLAVSKGRPYEFNGAGSTGQAAYFFELDVVIPISSHPIRYRSAIGFTTALEEPGIGLLGQNGFFDRFKITFDLPKGVFVIGR